MSSLVVGEVAGADVELLLGDVRRRHRLGGHSAPRIVPIAAGGLTVAAALVSLLGLGGDYVQRIYRRSSARPFFLVPRVHEAAASEPAAFETPGARR